MSTRHHSKKQKKPASKGLHPRNLHRQGYDFPTLLKSHPQLAPHVKKNGYGNLSIEFADPQAVKSLNTALLKHHYQINDWDIPTGALCPPVPGRADYIHYIADLLGYDQSATNQADTQPEIKLLDIGTGASGIYPLLACKMYGWRCVGSDISDQSLKNVTSIIAHNPELQDRFTLRQQPDKNLMFDGIIQAGEFFDVSVCNPPFHASREDALQSSLRKLNNLARNRSKKATGRRQKHRGDHKSGTTQPTLNFGGLETELWCKGGEKLFLKKMMKESRLFSDQCRWFTSLVSKVDHVKSMKKSLHKLGAVEVREIEMAQGNKVTRIIAWTFI